MLLLSSPYLRCLSIYKKFFSCTVMQPKLYNHHRIIQPLLPPSALLYWSSHPCTCYRIVIFNIKNNKLLQHYMHSTHRYQILSIQECVLAYIYWLNTVFSSLAPAIRPSIKAHMDKLELFFPHSISEKQNQCWSTQIPMQAHWRLGLICPP